MRYGLPGAASLLFAVGVAAVTGLHVPSRTRKARDVRSLRRDGTCCIHGGPQRIRSQRRARSGSE